MDAIVEYLDRFLEAITSKTARRAVVNSVLFFTASAALFSLAAFSYVLFYRSYLPDQITTIPVHLQYGVGPNPYALATLQNKNLKDQQPYDVTVSLTVPRSPPNLELGNFMVSLHLLDSSAAAAKKAPSHVPPHPHSHFEKRTILYSSRRPAIIPYTDPLVSLASRGLFIVYHIFFPSSERSALRVPMMEKLFFSRSSLIPGSLYLELEAGQALQVYSVSVTLTARLSGLRWFMYHYMITSFVVLTGAFWLFEMLIAALTWVVLSAYLSQGETRELVKMEEHRVIEPEPGALPPKSVVAVTGDHTLGSDDLSDTPRSFPSGRQLKHDIEAKAEEAPERLLEDIPAAGAEADDEDEDDASGTLHDSGIGTSHSDGSRATIRRRTSRTGSS